MGDNIFDVLLSHEADIDYAYNDRSSHVHRGFVALVNFDEQLEIVNRTERKSTYFTLTRDILNCL